MAKVTILQDICKGCGLCTKFCPKGCLQIAAEKINKKGHHPVESVKPEDCIGCGFCATMCPDCVITVER